MTRPGPCRARGIACRTVRVRAREHRRFGFEKAVVGQLVACFGPAAAWPDVLHVQDWSAERWTAPPTVRRLPDHSLFGHLLYRRPMLDGRLHWASTETAAHHPGHMEGALAAGERAALAVQAAMSTGWTR